MIDWSKGFTATAYASFMDIDTWRERDKFDITGGKIKFTDSNLRQSADIDCNNYNQTQEKWIRIWLDVKQGHSSEHIALFTGLVLPPVKDYEGAMQVASLECYSVLKPASDVLLDRGWYAPAGVRVADTIANLLSSVTPAPIVVEGKSPVLSQYVVAEDGESPLTMVEKLLVSIGWRLRINGMGEVRVCPTNTDPVVRFDPINNDCIEPKISLKNDWYDCPNVFRAVLDDMYAVARDDNPDSILSTVNRGREVWEEELDCDLSDNETLAEYADRRLKELQSYAIETSYDRRYNPSVYPSDVIQLHYPQQGLDGLFYVSEQSIDLDNLMVVSEEVIRYEKSKGH